MQNRPMQNRRLSLARLAAPALLALLTWTGQPGLAADRLSEPIAAAALRPADPALEEAQIRALLAEQQAAWNRADLEGYMRGYWQSDDLSFYSAGGSTRGWALALETYRRRHLGEGRPMGELVAGDIRIDFLSPESALVRGAWQLSMPGGDAYRGLTTLILRKFPEGWRIVHDHSS